MATLPVIATAVEASQVRFRWIANISHGADL